MLIANSLTKSFTGGFRLHPTSLQCAPGEVIGILGHNGSGKSTLFDMLTGTTAPDSGQVTLDSEKISSGFCAGRKKIGYLPQTLVLPDWLSPTDILDFYCSLANSSSEGVERSLKFWGCQKFQSQVVRSMSFGMKKRVALAAATIIDTRALILDEPFSGLDLGHVQTLEDLIRSRRQNSQITVLSTHFIPVAADICDRVYVLKDGKISESLWEPESSLSAQEKIDRIKEMIITRSLAEKQRPLYP